MSHLAGPTPADHSVPPSADARTDARPRGGGHSADPARALAEWQHRMRHAYRGASYGQFASAIAWAASATAATWGSASLAVGLLVVGGMGIYPATLLLMRLDGRRPPAPAANPLQRLGAQVALVLPLAMPVLLPVLARPGAPGFFPVMLILVGAHYLPFVFVYGMRSFVALAAGLVASGVLLLQMPAVGWAAGGWVGASALLAWAGVGRWIADRTETG